MKLNFKNEYISIKHFNTIELPDLSILTGLNGTGKSHFLKAIENGNVSIDGISKDEVAYFNYNDFTVDSRVSNNQNVINDLINRANNNKVKLFNSYREKIEALKRGLQLFSPIDAHIANLILNNVSPLEVFGRNGVELKDLIRRFPDFPQNAPVSNLEMLGINDQLFAFLNVFSSNGGIVKTLEYKDIRKKYKNIGAKLLKELNKDENYFLFLKNSVSKDKNIFNLNQDDFGNTSLFAFEISEEIKNYKIDYWENKNSENKISEIAFSDKFGEDPISLLNSVLTEYDCNGYFIDNDNFKPSYKQDNLKLIIPISLKNKIGGFITNLDQLSSGEKTLMAIAFLIYKLRKGKIFPRVLLLDEIDSALHPSMTKRLLHVIKDLFIDKNGMKVVFVTHSPTTIALAPEESIFVVHKTGENKLEKKSKEDALSILTEEYASLSKSDSDYSISYRINQGNKNFVILTEGITDKIILENAWKKLYNKQPYFYIQDCFNAPFLSQLMKRSSDPEDGLFSKYKEKAFVAIFDFDESGYNSWNDNDKFNVVCDSPASCLTKKHKSEDAYLLLLPVPGKNEEIKNQVIKNGMETFKDKSSLTIELLFYGFDETNRYFKKNQVMGGGNQIVFDYNKRKFAYLTDNFDKKCFANFLPLFEKINEVFNHS